MERRLAESEKQYRTLFDSIDEGFCIIEVLFNKNNKPIDYRFLDVNQAFEKHTGIAKARGKRMREIARDHEEHWFETYGQIALTGEPVRFENHAAQLHRWFDVYAFRIGEPQERKVAILFKDITDRKKLEQELTQARDAAIESAHLKSEFMANMSHEIRTPLNAIIGMTDLATHSTLSPEQKKYMDVVKKSGNQLLALINDILDFSKLEAAQMSLEMRDFDVKGEVETVVSMLSSQAQLKGLELKTSMGSGIPLAVRGDPHRLRQILTNLIGNAVKFTQKGAVTVGVERGSPKGESVSLRFRVKDSGIGIPPDRVNKLFQSFSQVDVSTTRKYGGTGLGLAISKRLVELMGGEIGVESAPGKGSTFWFTARFAKAQVVPHPEVVIDGAPTPSVSLSSRMAPAAPKILVAEDTEFSQMVAMEQLKKLGIKADLASNGFKALEALKKSSYDLILMDCMMPEMDGYKATQEIRKKEKGSHRVPIVAMTANALKGDREKCLEAGMTDYLAKPVTLADLQAVLERNLPSWRPELRVSSPVSASSEVSFDEARLREIAGGDEKKMRELTEVFLKTTSERLGLLTMAIKKKKSDEVQAIAHSSASGAGSFGAHVLFSLLKRVEEVGVQGKLEKAAPLLRDVQKEFERLKKRLAPASPRRLKGG